MAKEEVALEVKVGTGQSAQTVRQLKEEIRNVNSEMLKVKEGSAAYQSLAQRAGEAKEKIKDLKEATNLFTRGGTVSEIANVGQTIAGGFAAAAGAAALFGAESENIQKQMLKVQASIAIVEGVKSAIAGWESVQRLLNLAMAANPIGAVIALVVALTAAVAAYIVTSKKDNDEWKKKVGYIDEVTKAYDRNIALLQADGKETLAAEMSKQREIRKTNEEILEAFKFRKSLNKEETEARDKAIKDLEEANFQIRLITTKSDKLDRDEEAKSKAEKEKLAAEQKAKNLKAGEEKNKLLEETWQEALNIANEYTTKIGEVEDRANKKKLKDLQDTWDQALKIAGEFSDAGGKQEEEDNDERLAAEKKFAEARILVEKSVVDTLSVLSSVVGNESRDAIAIQKAIAIAQIAIDTARAIGSLTANSEANPLNAVTFGGAGIAQFATGIARIIANIAAAHKILGASGTPNIKKPSLSSESGGSSTPPPVNNVGIGVSQYGTNQDGDLTGQTKTQIVKAYVVESEMTSSQKNIASIIKKSKVE